jgi:hypothetical protein
MGIKKDSSMRLGLMIGDLEFGEEYLRGWVVVSAPVEGVRAKSSIKHSVFVTGSSMYSWNVCIVLTTKYYLSATQGSPPTEKCLVYLQCCTVVV